MDKTAVLWSVSGGKSGEKLVTFDHILKSELMNASKEDVKANTLFPEVIKGA
jgi:hypothetical protein